MNMPPPGPPFGPPPHAGWPPHSANAGAGQGTYLHGPHAGAAYGYAPPPTPRGSATSMRARVVGGMLLVAVVVAAVTMGIVRAQHDKEANYLVFDGDPKLRARVDGKDVGALKENIEARVVELTPGAHVIEIADAAGNVVESGRISAVPEHGYRALYAVGEGRGYAVLHVGYGREVDRPFQPLAPGEPHVYVLPPEPYLNRRALASLDHRFPSSVRSKSSTTAARICSLDADGAPTCL